MSELYKVAASFVVKPYAWGKFENTSSPLTHFLVLDFKEMNPNSKGPDPKKFCSQLAKLHQESVSPTGKFGFGVHTTHGKFPQYMEWNSSWESMFRKLLSNLLVRDFETNGPWKEFQNVYERALTLVLPKLIGPLESNGRTIKPCLLHADLWSGNTGTDPKTGEVYIFDAASFYGHNELELAMWRGDLDSHMVSDIYIREYFEHFDGGVSEPVEQFDNRNRMYNVMFLMWHSAHHPSDPVRQR